jgi:TonB family protein
MISMLAGMMLLAQAPEETRPLAPPPPPSSKRKLPTHARANLGALISTDDYPMEALRNGEEGIVGFKLEVNAEGMVTTCTVTKPSGSTSLDATTCRLMKERARFTPARKRDGRPLADRVRARIVWRIEGESKQGSHLTPFAARLSVEKVSWNPGGQVTCTEATHEDPEHAVPCPTGSAGLLGRSVERTFVTTFTPDGEAELTDGKDHGTMFVEAAAVISIAADGSIIACQMKRSDLPGATNSPLHPRGLCELFDQALGPVFDPMEGESAPRILTMRLRVYSRE